MFGLSACSRPETTDYVSQVSGLELCESATVSNVKTANAGIGFEQHWILKMDDGCRRRFYAAINRKWRKNCVPDAPCLIKFDGDNIFIEPGSSFISVIYAGR